MTNTQKRKIFEDNSNGHHWNELKKLLQVKYKTNMWRLVASISTHDKKLQKQLQDSDQVLVIQIDGYSEDERTGKKDKKFKPIKKDERSAKPSRFDKEHRIENTRKLNVSDILYVRTFPPRVKPWKTESTE
jgi:hypothetical protein